MESVTVNHPKTQVAEISPKKNFSMNTTPSTAKNVRTVKLRRNYNHKLSCDRFIHIDEPPPADIPKEVLEKTMFVIHTTDGSHPPVKKKIQWITTFRLGELTALHTWLSHGMDTTEFIEFLHLEKKLHVNPDLQLAIYYYKEIEQ